MDGSDTVGTEGQPEVGGSIPGWQWQMMAVGMLLLALFAWQRGAGDEREAPPPEQEPVATVAAAVVGETVWVVPALGGVPREAYRAPAGESVVAAAVGREGRSLYVQTLREGVDARIWAVGLDGGGAPRELARLGDAAGEAPVAAAGPLLELVERLRASGQDERVDER